MHTLSNWKAKRAGGRITVYGVDEKGTSTKIVGVDKIEPGMGCCFAIDKSGVSFRLAV